MKKAMNEKLQLYFVEILPNCKQTAERKLP